MTTISHQGPQFFAGQSRLFALSRRIAYLCIVPALLLVIWQLLAVAIHEYAIASPAATFKALASGIEKGWLLKSLAVTLSSTLYAVAISCIVGLLCGVLLGRSPYWRAVFEQPAVWIYSLPKVVLYPVLVLMLGLGAKSNIAFAVLQGVFPPLLILAAVVADLPPVYVKLAKVQQLSTWRFFRSIVIPYSLPSIAMSFRYSFSLSYMGIVVAEMFAAESGIGFDLIKSISLGQMPRMFAIVTVITGLALIINFILLAIERRLSLPAQPSVVK
jgi:NitT/TauT family transport system permease protein